MCKHQRHNGGDSLNSFVGVFAKLFGLHATLNIGRLISLGRQRGNSIIGHGITVIDVHGRKARNRNLSVIANKNSDIAGLKVFNSPKQTINICVLTP